MRALVVFTGDNNHPLSWLLKDGFRHCFVCLESDGLWLLVDGGAGIPEIKYLTESDFDLAAFFREKGMTVIETVQGRAVTWPFALRNCVGLSKSVLCLSGWALTPYSLFRYLRKKNATITRI